MNLPNKLTVLRIILVPVFMILYMMPSDIAKGIATAIFVIAALTDWLDGYIARKYNLVTNFGKFADPIADKLLTIAAFLLLQEGGLIPAWMNMIFIGRELLVSGLRLVAVEQGHVVAAGKLGKIKTVLQMICIIVFLLGKWPFAIGDVPMASILLWAALLMTVVSGVEYFVANWAVLQDKSKTKVR